MVWRRMVATVSSVGLVAAALLGPTASGAEAIFHKPRIPNHSATTSGAWSSSNWSGYAITSGAPYNAITGTWTVPAAGSTKTASYSSNWIGIDGFNNSNLIQTGTESDNAHGRATYAAWWEILPAAETRISSITVRPGDVMTASISKGTGSSWTITLTDTTTGKSFSTVQNYTGPQTSAEWIEEAPQVGGKVATLAHYGQSKFDPGTVNSGNPHLTSGDSGVMVQKGVQVSTPSLPDGDTDGFNVAYGSAIPAAPAT